LSNAYRTSGGGVPLFGQVVPEKRHHVFVRCERAVGAAVLQVGFGFGQSRVDPKLSENSIEGRGAIASWVVAAGRSLPRSRSADGRLQKRPERRRNVEIPPGCQPDPLGADQIRRLCVPDYF